RWGVGFGDTTAAGFGRTHLDSAGRPVVAGTAIASILLGQDTLPPVPDGLPFIARFDENGNHAWHLSLGDAAGGSLAAVGQSSAGEVHLVGSTNSPTLDIGTGAITAGQGKSFVMKLGR